MEKELLLSVGGWQALTQGEDFGMVMAVTNKANGFVLNESVYHYRKHEHQMTKEAGFNDWEGMARVMAFARS